LSCLFLTSLLCSGGGDSEFYDTNSLQYKAGAAAGAASGSVIAAQFAAVELLTANIPIGAVFSSGLGQALGGFGLSDVIGAIAAFVRRRSHCVDCSASPVPGADGPADHVRRHAAQGFHRVVLLVIHLQRFAQLILIILMFQVEFLGPNPLRHVNRQTNRAR